MNTKWPRFLDIDLSTLCQLKCNMCPYLEIHKKREFMSIERFKKIINQINWKCSIKLCQYSEPLLSPILIDAIKITYNKGLRTVINTNGLLLCKLGWELINARLETLILSDYGLEKQIENGIHFATLNNYYKHPVEFIVKTERPEVWEGITDNIIKPIYYDHSGMIEDDTPLPNWKCEQLFERLVIRPDNHVDCCCGHIHSDKNIGNINENTLLEIWNSEKLQNYRKLHLEGKSHLAKMCLSCDVRKEEIRRRKENEHKLCYSM